MFVALLSLVGCNAGPNLVGKSWELSYLPGPDIVAAGPDCDLTMTMVDDGSIEWPERCGRGDLPVNWEVFGSWPTKGYAYVVSGSGNGQSWMTRGGDHGGLNELWIYAPNEPISHASEFDAIAVVPFWRVRDDD